jgi:SAM-dependent methyltransferase
MRKDLANFYNDLSAWYDLMYLAQGVKPGAYNPDVVKAYDWLLRKKRSKYVIDCACGTGDPLIGLYKLQRRRYNLCGSDGSQSMLNKCKNNTISEGIRITSRSTDANGELPLIHCSWKDLGKKFKNNRFDFIMCRGHGFYHLTTRDAFIETLCSFASVARKGGWILFDTLYWKYNQNNRACGEQGRELAKWRGTVNFIESPHLRKYLPSSAIPENINRIYFADYTDYREDSAAVGGVLQTKTLVIFGEKANGKVEQIGHCSASGAAFSSEESKKLLRDSGMEDVQQINAPQFNEFKRHVVLMGRKR